MQDPSIAEVSDLIAMIYDCALDPEGWPEALQSACRLLRFRYAALSLQALPAGTPLLHASTGLTRAWLSRIPDYSADFIERWGGRARVDTLPLSEPAVLSRVNADWNAAASRYAREWAEPLGIHDVMALGVLREPDAIGSIILARHRDDGPIADREVAVARLLLPHLQRVIAISRLLDTERLTASSLRAALDRIAVGVMLIDAGRAILHANRSAETMLRGGDPVSSCRNRVQLNDRAASDALQAAIVETGNSRNARSRPAAIDVPLSDEQGNHFMLHILPLAGEALRADLAAAPAAALFLNPISLLSAVRRPALATMFDLTDAEARVMEAVTGGMRIEPAARALGISAATVKTHLQHIFDKTGVRRQTDLVALAASLIVSPPG